MKRVKLAEHWYVRVQYLRPDGSAIDTTCSHSVNSREELVGLRTSMRQRYPSATRTIVHVTRYRLVKKGKS